MALLSAPSRRMSPRARTNYHGKRLWESFDSQKEELLDGNRCDAMRASELESAGRVNFDNFFSSRFVLISSL